MDFDGSLLDFGGNPVDLMENCWIEWKSDGFGPGGGNGQGGTEAAPKRHRSVTKEAKACWRVPPTKYFVLRSEVLKA